MVRDWNTRTIAVAVLVAVMAAGSIDWRLLRVPLTNYQSLHEAIALFPDLTTPAYPRFLERVRASTPPGSAIAVAVPRSWTTGYEYAYYRAAYFLSGRTVIPLLDDADKPHLERLEHADYVAVWNMPFDSPLFANAWSANGGSLVRRKR